MRTIEPARLGLSPGDHLLDVGCGEGRHVHAAHAHADVKSAGIDLDRERLVRAREGFEVFDASQPFDLARADAGALPFVDSSFDAVVCSEVLEHLPNYGKTLDEIERVLKPGGRLGVSVPRYGPERLCWVLSSEYHETDGGHVRIFRREELENALCSRGLRIVDSGFAHALHSPYWWLKCLLWDRDDPAPVRAYERLLEWDIRNEPRVTRAIEELLNPLVGKSLVLYCEKEAR